MKKFGLILIAATTLCALPVSAMPRAPLRQALPANVETVALICGPSGCVRTTPAPVPPGPRPGVIRPRKKIK